MPDSAYAEWLQSPERLVTRDDAVLAVRWGDDAEAGSVSSVLDGEVDANAEAARHAAFKSGPLVEEEVIVPRLLDVALYRGRAWTIRVEGDEVYAAGLLVFVLGGEVSHQTGTTRLFVIRML
jgi:hypothetical protein